MRGTHRELVAVNREKLVMASKAEELAGPLSALTAVIDELITLVEQLPDCAFQGKSASVVGLKSSIGEHVRHCLDHLKSLQRGVVTGRIDYHHRERGASVERDSVEAMNYLRDAQYEFQRLPHELLDRPVEVCDFVSTELPPQVFASTFGREVLYALTHTIHHQAILRVLASAAGVGVAEPFGYSPSTLIVGTSHRCAAASGTAPADSDDAASLQRTVSP
jgi:hypothetical protein